MEVNQRKQNRVAIAEVVAQLDGLARLIVELEIERHLVIQLLLDSAPLKPAGREGWEMAGERLTSMTRHVRPRGQGDQETRGRGDKETRPQGDGVTSVQVVSLVIMMLSLSHVLTFSLSHFSLRLFSPAAPAPIRASWPARWEYESAR